MKHINERGRITFRNKNRAERWGKVLKRSLMSCYLTLIYLCINVTVGPLSRYWSQKRVALNAILLVKFFTRGLYSINVILLVMIQVVVFPPHAIHYLCWVLCSCLHSSWCSWLCSWWCSWSCWRCCLLSSSVLPLVDGRLSNGWFRLSPLKVDFD